MEEQGLEQFEVTNGGLGHEQQQAKVLVIDGLCCAGVRPFLHQLGVGPLAMLIGLPLLHWRTIRILFWVFCSFSSVIATVCSFFCC